ncbi:uncharacterized protein LOC108598810 [Drosophila busckii]|uniref:uncharacterized protein LOC108598810 n=1 Tax=Drosophila busckii TaxID=30019 RepID=UPI001432D3B2|nr:uncharacterized protein LOC108598810 [Drosophila busckii]
MEKPCEKCLDQHFSSQLIKYNKKFKQFACKSDQSIIHYWLDIFRAAPNSQKLARNGLMLLMYGHLKEMGYLQAPFTDMRNCGRDLNDILDDYEGMVDLKKERAATDLLHCRHERNSNLKSRETLPNLKKVMPSTNLARPFESSSELVQTKTESEFETELESSYRVFGPRAAASAEKYNLPSPEGLYNQQRDQQQLEDSSEDDYDSFVTGSMALQDYESFDSHKSYKKQYEYMKDEQEQIDAEEKLLNELQNVIEELTGDDDDDDEEQQQQLAELPKIQSPKIQAYEIYQTKSMQKMLHEAPMPQEIIRKYIPELPKRNCNCDLCDAFKEIETESEKSLPVSQGYGKRDCEPNLVPATILLDETCLEPTEEIENQLEAKRAALEAEVRKLRRRAAMLRSQCLKYYDIEGNLMHEYKQHRLEQKHPQGWHWIRGFVVDAYRALHRYTGWRSYTTGDRRQKEGLQTYLSCGGHAWRYYRRTLLLSNSPCWRLLKMEQILDSKRELLLLRMSNLLRLKQISTEVCYGKMSNKELELLLAVMDNKYLELAKHLHWKLFKLIN